MPWGVQAQHKMVLTTRVNVCRVTATQNDGTKRAAREVVESIFCFSTSSSDAVATNFVLEDLCCILRGGVGWGGGEEREKICCCCTVGAV